MTMTATTLAAYQVGDRVDDFALPDLPGRTRRLSEEAGMWTVICFTASWFPYRSAEPPFVSTGWAPEEGDRPGLTSAGLARTMWPCRYPYPIEPAP
jgi:hypothetical protein